MDKEWEIKLQPTQHTHTHLWWSQHPCSQATPGPSQAGPTRPRSHIAPHGCAAVRLLGPGPGPGLGPRAGRGPGRPAWLTSHWYRDKGAMGYWSWSSTELSGLAHRQQVHQPGGKEAESFTQSHASLWLSDHLSVHLSFPTESLTSSTAGALCTALAASKLNKLQSTGQHFSFVRKCI